MLEGATYNRKTGTTLRLPINLSPLPSATMASRKRRRQRSRKNKATRLVIRRSREVHNEFRIVIGAAAAFGLLVLMGFDIGVLLAIGALVGFIGFVFVLVRGPSPLFEIVSDDEPVARAGMPDMDQQQSFADVESVPGVVQGPSDNLDRALGPLAAELHGVEMELLEQAANGRFPAQHVARLAQEFAKNRPS
jgi:hypothetical protein